MVVSSFDRWFADLRLTGWESRRCCCPPKSVLYQILPETTAMCGIAEDCKRVSVSAVQTTALRLLLCPSCLKWWNTCKDARRSRACDRYYPESLKWSQELSGERDLGLTARTTWRSTSSNDRSWQNEDRRILRQEHMVAKHSSVMKRLHITCETMSGLSQSSTTFRAFRIVLCQKGSVDCFVKSCIQCRSLWLFDYTFLCVFCLCLLQDFGNHMANNLDPGVWRWLGWFLRRFDDIYSFESCRRKFCHKCWNAKFHNVALHANGEYTGVLRAELAFVSSTFVLQVSMEYLRVCKCQTN